MSATMTDVAKAAGVSIATVGRVIHNNGYVSQQAREKIETAIRALGYVPNQMARTLKKNRSGIIGSFVIYNPNDLYHRINQSIMEAAQKNGFELLTMEGRKGNIDDERLINYFIGMKVDGLVITSHPGIAPELFAHLHNANIPVVAVERGYTSLGIDSLVVQDFEGIYQAVKRIAEAGHKQIGFIAVHSPHEVEQQRLCGYQAAIEECGLTSLIQIVDTYSVENGRKAMEKLLALNTPPTAICTTADTLAAGAMQALYSRGIRIPEGMSIVGYDNVLSRSLSPPIDSVDLVLEDIGEAVLSLLMSRMEHMEKAAEVRQIHTVYVDRKTVRQI